MQVKFKNPGVVIENSGQNVEVEVTFGNELVEMNIPVLKATLVRKINPKVEEEKDNDIDVSLEERPSFSAHEFEYSFAFPEKAFYKGSSWRLEVTYQGKAAITDDYLMVEGN